jgi:hypothetical protein
MVCVMVLSLWQIGLCLFKDAHARTSSNATATVLARLSETRSKTKHLIVRTRFGDHYSHKSDPVVFICERDDAPTR